MFFALGLSLFAGCSSLGGFDYGDGEADRFTAGDDVPYVPTDDDDDASTSAPHPGQTGTGVEPTSTDDGAATDLVAESSSGDESGPTEDGTDASSGTEGGTDETGASDTSGTSGPDDPSNLPQPETGAETSGGSESTSGE